MKELYELTSLDEVDVFIEKHKWSLLYISRPECTVCHAVLPKLRELLVHYPQIYLGHINANQVEAIAAKFLTFTVPTMILMIEQKEYLRADRFVRFDDLNKLIERILGMNTGSRT